MTGVVPARAVALLTVLLVALSGCSTVPDSSSTVQVTQAPVRPSEDVGIEPSSPSRGATPEEVVRGFIDAAASTVPGHPVAREHLAPVAAESWSDVNGIIVISPDYATVTTGAGTVRVTANLVGTVDQRGVFAVGGDSPFTRQYTLEEVEDEWRITDPAGGLVMLEPDFQRLYDPVAAYFLDPTRQRVVPDPRYLITGEAQPNALVQRLLDGPSSSLDRCRRGPDGDRGPDRPVDRSCAGALGDVRPTRVDPAAAAHPPRGDPGRR
jgi:hypothetical protein